MTRHLYLQTKYLLILQPQVMPMQGPIKGHACHTNNSNLPTMTFPSVHKKQPAKLAILPNKLFYTSHCSRTKNTSQPHQTIHASAKIIYQQYSPVYITQTSENISRTARTLPNLIQSLESLGNMPSSEEEQASHKTQVMFRIQKTKLLFSSRLP